MNALLLFMLAASAQPVTVPLEDGSSLVLDAKHAPKGVKPDAWAKSVAAGLVSVSVGGVAVWTKPSPAPAPAPKPEPRSIPEPPKAARAPEHDAFWADLRALCGKAFEGAIAAKVGGGAGPDPFEGKTLVMHVRECGDDEIRVPFHVGDDRSRTWVFTRTEAGLRLKHDHRHKDGSDDPVTMYGGDTVEPGRAHKQSFPADAFSREMFVREKLPQAVENVWVVGMLPGKLFSYALIRPGRQFMVDFDLSRPVAAPPPPWGSK